MTEPAFNWPKKGDNVFGPLARVAREGFVMPPEGAYLFGFKLAADMVVAAVPTEGRYANDLFFPIAYLYRHHLELMLKELIRLGLRLGSLNGCEDILGEHSLHRLWNKAKQLIKASGPNGTAVRFCA